jgi:hypothetical protein
MSESGHQRHSQHPGSSGSPEERTPMPAFTLMSARPNERSLSEENNTLIERALGHVPSFEACLPPASAKTSSADSGLTVPEGVRLKTERG